jgi:TetR/AcrR family transcriptional regulator of autoinduction and epiphytic fitness
MNAPIKLTDRKRQAIVEAAIAEFRSSGFESTSMDKIAATAGVPLRAQLLDILGRKMDMLQDAYFLDLARVAIAEAIHSPERAHEMVARLSDKEEAVTRWLRAAQADGKLLKIDAALASHMLQGQLKTFAFWPQVTLDQPPLDAAMQKTVVETTVDMFLAYAA